MADGASSAPVSSMEESKHSQDDGTPGPGSASLWISTPVETGQPNSPGTKTTVGKTSPKGKGQSSTAAPTTRQGAKRKDRTELNDTGSNSTQFRDGKAVNVFSKDSAEYREFLEIVTKNDWTERLPTTKNASDLKAFMEKTGFSRAQIVRKFNELQRWRWMNAKEAILQKRKMPGSNATLFTGEQAQAKRHIPTSKVSSDHKVASPFADLDNTQKADMLQKESMPFTFPTIRANYVPQRQEFPTTYSDPPPMLRQGSSSALSPLRSKKFHEVSLFSSHPMMTDPLGPSISSLQVPPPPSLLRIHTAEEEALLKGSIMRDPDHDPLPLHPIKTQDVYGWSNENDYHLGSCQNLVEPHFLSYYHGTQDMHGYDGLALSNNNTEDTSRRFTPRRRNSFVYHHGAQQAEGQEGLHQSFQDLFSSSI